MNAPAPNKGPPAFSEALVPRLWAALCERLQDPVRVTTDRKGTRTVEVLGALRYFILPTARRVHFAYAVGKGRFVTGRMREFVSLDPVLMGDSWLAHFAANWFIHRGHVLEPSQGRGAEGGAFVAFAQNLRHSRAFQVLRERVRVCRIEGPLRDRVEEALALDRRVIAWACLGLPRGELAAIDSLQYSAAWRHREAFEQLERENPALLRPYAGAVLAGALGHHQEPARDLKLAFRAIGVGDAQWKLLANAAPGYFETLIAGTKSDHIFDAYGWALQACVAAGGMLPRAVLHRLVQPNGREPGQPAVLDPETINSGFWMPFLRALGRRIAFVDGPGQMRAFLDGEFEDVYDWLEWECPEIDPNQARAGWPWLLKQNRAWREREREMALARRDELRWDVPLPTFEHGSWRVVALRDSYELWEEGHALRHCARTYADYCRKGFGIVFSIRNSAGERVATGQIDRQRGPWTVRSVRVFANRPAGPKLVEVAQAYARASEAAQWLWTEPEQVAA